jgi:hypothetical protein
MAEQIISPGVFTRENDLSFLPQGVGAIGAAIVGPTVKGPAFIPTVVKSFAEYRNRFGGLSQDTFVPQTVREYLKNAGSVTVCRVLGGGGYNYKNGTNESIAIVVNPSGSADGMIVGTIFPSKSTNVPDLGKTSLTNASNPLSARNNLSGGVYATGSSFITSGSKDGTAIDGSAGTLHVSFSGDTITDTMVTASINPNAEDYIFKILGGDPNNSKTSVSAFAGTPGYTYTEHKELLKLIVGNAEVTGYGAMGASADIIGSGSIVSFVTQSGDIEFEGINGQPEGYSYASTPYIQSQIGLGQKNLFKVHTLNHGRAENTEYKISIANLREPADIDGEEQYSTFSLIVRKYEDDDKNPQVIEQYNNLNLNPDDSNYIARKVGDRYPQYNDTLSKVELLGNYPNVSNCIRIEVADNVASKATSPKLSPKGFAAVINPVPTASYGAHKFPGLAGSVDMGNILYPSCSFEGEQILSNNYNNKGYLGWKFSDKASDNGNWIKPLPKIQESNVAGAFNVENYFAHPSSSYGGGETAKSLSASLDVTGGSGPTSEQLKFTVPFQAGEDGLAPYIHPFTGAESSLSDDYSTDKKLFGFDLSTSSASGSKAYQKALDILSNQDEYDINMLALPGVIKELHSSTTTAAIDMVESRGDAFYVMDLCDKEKSVNGAINEASGLDTNYAAVYYPWVKVLDSDSNKPVLVPPSVIVPGAIAASDAIAAEWFAPAGLNRGILGNVLEAKMRLNQAERDSLYNAKINPIATFPQTGVCIWGQKTLQERSTALDRINVRRLLIALKKYIASSSRYLVFEQNTIETRDRFLNIVNPYLESVQSRQGLYAFRVTMDESNNTPDVIDRNELVGAIFLQPTKTAEFIVLDFNVMPTGATFDGAGGSY